MSVGGDGGVRFWQIVDSRFTEVAAAVGQYDVVARPVWSFDDAWIATLRPEATVLWPRTADSGTIEIPTGASAVDCAFAGPDGSRLIITFGDGPAKVWEWATGEELAALPASAGITRVVGGPHGLCGIDPQRGGVWLWNELDSAPRQLCPEYSVIDVSVAGDGRMMAVAADGTLLLVSADGNVESTTSGDPLGYLGWWPRAGLAAGVGAEHGFVVRSASGQTTTTGPRYTAVTVRDDGLVAAGDAAGWIEVRSMTPGETSSAEIASVAAHTAALVDVQWSTDDSTVLAVTDSGIRMYPLHAFDEPARLDAIRGAPIRAIATQIDGTLVTALVDGSLLVYHHPDGPVVLDLPPGSIQDPVLAGHPQGGFLCAEPDGQVRRWSMDGHELEAVTTGIRPLSLSVAADRWALLGEDGTLALGTAMPEFAQSSRETSTPIGVTLSPDGWWAALVDADGLRILASTGADAQQPESLLVEGVRCAAWSPDGRLLAIGSSGGWIEVRAVGSWQPVHRIPVSEAVTSLAWSSSGRYLASGTDHGLLTVAEHLGMGEITEWLRSRVTEPMTAEERDRYGIPPSLSER